MQEENSAGASDAVKSSRSTCDQVCQDRKAEPISAGLGSTCHKRTHLGFLGEIHQRDRYRERSGSSQSGERPSIATINICWRYLEALETGQNT